MQDFPAPTETTTVRRVHTQPPDDMNVRLHIYTEQMLDVRDQRASVQEDIYCAWGVIMFVFAIVFGILIGKVVTTHVKAERVAYIFGAVGAMFVFVAVLWCVKKMSIVPAWPADPQRQPLVSAGNIPNVYHTDNSTLIVPMQPC